VKRVLLFHHDPSHDDDMIDRMVEQARELVRKSGKAMVIEGAREGAEMLLEEKEISNVAPAEGARLKV
jgi:cobyric acid synthase